MAEIAGLSSPSQTFWLDSRKETLLAAYSPFVVSLASGTLEVETFRQYISQDAYFLMAFVQAYELAEEYSDNVHVRAVITELRMAVLDELKLHDFVLQEWSVDVTKEIVPNPATLKYTEFLLAIASGKLGGNILTDKGNHIDRRKLVAYIIGSMTPCMRLYAFLGKKLEIFMGPDKSNHPYKTWIATYASDAFESSALQIEDLLDRLCAVFDTEDELQFIFSLYYRAMQLEVEFFYSQPNNQLVIAPFIRYCNAMSHHLVIFCDFDLTCSITDVLAVSKSENHPEYRHAKELSAMQVRLEFNFSMQKEHEDLITKMLAFGDTRFNFELLHKVFILLSDFEREANSRVIESKVLQGLNLDEVKHAGKRLIFHKECLDFLRSMLEKDDLNVDLHVLSSYWCGDLIRGAFSAGGLNILNLHSNELQYRGLISTGDINRKIESPLDKLETLNRIIKDFTNKDKCISLYIGDSVNDLLCLLKADIGIVVGSNANLRRLAAAFGVSFVKLYPGIVEKQKEAVKDGVPVWTGLSGILYTVNNWADLYAFLLGC